MGHDMATQNPWSSKYPSHALLQPIQSLLIKWVAFFQLALLALQIMSIRLDNYNRGGNTTWHMACIMGQQFCYLDLFIMVVGCQATPIDGQANAWQESNNSTDNTTTKI